MWLQGYQRIGGWPQRCHISSTTAGAKKRSSDAAKRWMPTGRQLRCQIVPADLRDELPELLDAPAELAQLSPHALQDRRVGDHGGEVHVSDQRDGEGEALVQAGEGQRERASQAEAHDAHRSRILGQQPAEQGARVEEVLAERLEAAHQVRGPVELTAEARAARRAAAVVGRLELDDLDVEDPRHAHQQRELLEVGLRLQVAVQVEQPRATPRDPQGGCAGRRRCGSRRTRPGSAGGTAARWARAGTGRRCPR